jgi:mono/diheme cytochrome c family protein
MLLGRCGSVTAIVAVFLCGSVAADIKGVESEQRARINYMLNCQGCHGPDGAGTRDGVVPLMKNFVGNFLKVDGGREFLARVPGSANAAVDDAQLAELLNWMLYTLSPEQVPIDFVPYEAKEVHDFRNNPLVDVYEVRTDLLTRIGVPE